MQLWAPGGGAGRCTFGPPEHSAGALPWAREAAEFAVPACGVDDVDRPDSCNLACYPNSDSALARRADDERLSGEPGDRILRLRRRGQD